MWRRQVWWLHVIMKIRSGAEKGKGRKIVAWDKSCRAGMAHAGSVHEFDKDFCENGA